MSLFSDLPKYVQFSTGTISDSRFSEYDVLIRYYLNQNLGIQISVGSLGESVIGYLHINKAYSLISAEDCEQKYRESGPSGTKFVNGNFLWDTDSACIITHDGIIKLHFQETRFIPQISTFEKDVEWTYFPITPSFDCEEQDKYTRIKRNNELFMEIQDWCATDGNIYDTFCDENNKKKSRIVDCPGNCGHDGTVVSCL